MSFYLSFWTLLRHFSALVCLTRFMGIMMPPFLALLYQLLLLHPISLCSNNLSLYRSHPQKVSNYLIYLCILVLRMVDIRRTVELREVAGRLNQCVDWFEVVRDQGGGEVRVALRYPALYKTKYCQKRLGCSNKGILKYQWLEHKVYFFLL